MIHLPNTFPFNVLKIFHSACIDKTECIKLFIKKRWNISLDSTYPSFILAFCIRQKAADGFSWNSAAAYRSLFSFSITHSIVCSISSHKTSVSFHFVLHSLTNLWHLADTINKKHVISNLKLSSFAPMANNFKKLMTNTSSILLKNNEILKFGTVQ